MFRLFVYTKTSKDLRIVLGRRFLITSLFEETAVNVRSLRGCESDNGEKALASPVWFLTVFLRHVISSEGEQRAEGQGTCVRAAWHSGLLCKGTQLSMHTFHWVL